MKKEEYMGALKDALAEFEEELVQEIVNDYEERFRVGFVMSPSIEIELFLPSGIPMVEITSASGDCLVDGLEGAEGKAQLVIKTASGDVKVREVRVANIEINTASGDISINVQQADRVKLSTASGYIETRECHADYVEGSTVSGDIDIKTGSRRCVAKSQSGEVKLELCQDADVTANSMSGDVTVTFL